MKVSASETSIPEGSQETGALVYMCAVPGGGVAGRLMQCHDCLARWQIDCCHNRLFGWPAGRAGLGAGRGKRSPHLAARRRRHLPRPALQEVDQRLPSGTSKRSQHQNLMSFSQHTDPVISRTSVFVRGLAIGPWRRSSQIRRLYRRPSRRSLSAIPAFLNACSGVSR